MDNHILEMDAVPPSYRHLDDGRDKDCEPRHDARFPGDKMSCEFKEVFPEPESPRLPDGIKQVYEMVFRALLTFFYMLLAFVLGPVLVLLFSVMLAINSFILVWVMNPCFKCHMMCFTKWESYLEAWLSCCCAPYLRALGNCCSKIVVRYQQVAPGEIIHV